MEGLSATHLLLLLVHLLPLLLLPSASSSASSPPRSRASLSQNSCESAVLRDRSAPYSAGIVTVADIYILFLSEQRERPMLHGRPMLTRASPVYRTMSDASAPCYRWDLEPDVPGGLPDTCPGTSQPGGVSGRPGPVLPQGCKPHVPGGLPDRRPGTSQPNRERLNQEAFRDGPGPCHRK